MMYSSCSKNLASLSMWVPRIYDIELMTIELRNLYDSRLIDHDTYMTAWRILKREHRIEESRKKGNL